MEIIISNKKSLINSNKYITTNHIIISINSVGSVIPKLNNNKYRLSELFLFFNDTDDINNTNAIKNKDVKDIKNFILEYKNDIELIIVSCSAGISRSSAIAAALALYFNGSDKEIFNNPKFKPNKLVYRKMLEGLGYKLNYTGVNNNG